MQYPNRARASVALTAICALAVALSCFTPISVQAQDDARQETDQVPETSIGAPDVSSFIESNGPDSISEWQDEAGTKSYTVAFTRNITSEAMGEQVLADAGLSSIAIEFAHGEGSAEFMATPAQAEVLRQNPDIAGLVVTPTIKLSTSAAAPQLQMNPGWALDSLDGKNDGVYEYDFTGKGVHAYVIDSELNNRSEFVDRIRNGYAVTQGTDNPYNCPIEGGEQHGTFVTLSLAGDTTGTGRDVLVHNVAISRCNELEISSREMNLGVTWVEDHLELPAVVNISWASYFEQEDNVLLTYERTLLRLVERGAVVVIGAGNDQLDSCRYAPARLPGVFTIGALTTNLNFATLLSNSGECVDGFTPGVAIPLAGVTKTGTSFATPLAAGLIAQVLERQPRRSASGAISQLLMNARHDIARLETALPGTPNVRLQTPKASDRRAPIVEVRTRPTGDDRSRAVVAIQPESYIGESFEVFLDGASRIRGTLQSNSSGQTVVRLNGITPGRHTLSVEVAGTKIYGTRIYGVASRDSMTVIPAVSCLGFGRVDLNIVNTSTSTRRFRVEFGSLTPREYDIPPGDYWRLPFTGRRDGQHKIVVSAPGFADWETVVEVSCGSAFGRAVSPAEIQVINACRNGDGYVTFQFVNPRNTKRSYVIEFGSIPRRSTTAAYRGQATRSVSGRPDGVHPVRIWSGSTLIADINVIVDCDNQITTRDTVGAR